MKDKKSLLVFCIFLILLLLLLVVVMFVSTSEERISQHDALYFQSLLKREEPAVVETNKAKNIDVDSAVLSGELVNLGENNKVEIRFRYGKNKENLSDQTDWLIKDSKGDFEYFIDNLSQGTTYYFKAEMRDSADSYYGNILSFTTKIARPSVAVTEIKDIAYNEATLRGTVNNMEGVDAIEVWIERGRSETHFNEKSFVRKMQEPGEFSITISELEPNTDYYVRAFIEGADMFSNSEVLNFQTEYFFSSKIREMIMEEEGEIRGMILNADEEKFTIRKGEEEVELYYNDNTEFFLNPTSERRNYIDDFFDEYEGVDCPRIPDEELADFRLREIEIGEIMEGDEGLFLFFNYESEDYFISRVIVER